MSDYKFFDDMGVRVFDNGHSFSGVELLHPFQVFGDAGLRGGRWSRPTASSVRTTSSALTRHNTVYFPSLTIKGAIQAIRVVKPIAVDKTVIESWTFRLRGAPPELLQRTVMYTRLINSPISVVGHDDLHAYRGIQEGLHASGNDWVSLHRNYDPAEVGSEGDHRQRHQRDLDAQPVPRLGPLHDAVDVRRRC